jgi:hypothetical protein
MKGEDGEAFMALHTGVAAGGNGLSPACAWLITTCLYDHYQEADGSDVVVGDQG